MSGNPYGTGGHNWRSYLATPVGLAPTMGKPGTTARTSYDAGGPGTFQSPSRKNLGRDPEKTGQPETERELPKGFGNSLWHILKE